MCLGSSKKLLHMTVERVSRRKAFGRSLSEFALVKDRVAGMTADLFALESLTYLTTGLVDSGQKDFAVESAICKVFGSEALWRVANEAAQGIRRRPRLLAHPRLGAPPARRAHPHGQPGHERGAPLLIALSGMQGPGRDLEEVGRSMREPSRGLRAPLRHRAPPREERALPGAPRASLKGEPAARPRIRALRGLRRSPRAERRQGAAPPREEHLGDAVHAEARGGHGDRPVRPRRVHLAHLARDQSTRRGGRAAPRWNLTSVFTSGAERRLAETWRRSTRTTTSSARRWRRRPAPTAATRSTLSESLASSFHAEGSNAARSPGARSSPGSCARSTPRPSGPLSFVPDVPAARGAPVAPRRAPDAATVVGAARARLTERTCALYLSTPNNPTGQLLAPPVVEALVAFAREHDLWSSPTRSTRTTSTPPCRTAGPAGWPPSGPSPSTRPPRPGHGRQPLRLGGRAGRGHGPRPQGQRAHLLQHPHRVQLAAARAFAGPGDAWAAAAREELRSARRPRGGSACPPRREHLPVPRRDLAPRRPRARRPPRRLRRPRAPRRARPELRPVPTHVRVCFTSAPPEVVLRGVNVPWQVSSAADDS